MELVQEMFEILGSGFTSWAQAFGTGIQSFISNLWLTTVEGVSQLSTFGQVALAFMAISMAIGLSYVIFNFLRSLGQR